MYRGALRLGSQETLSRLLGFDGLRAVRGNRDELRLLGLGDLAHEVEMEQAVLEGRTHHLHAVGQLEAPVEAAGRDALVENVNLALFCRLALAANGEGVLLDLDGQVAIGEAGDRDG